VKGSFSQLRRPAVRLAMLALACASAAWGIWLVVFGGFDITIIGVRIRSNDPRRLLLVAGLASVGFLLAGGTMPVRAGVTRLRGWLAALSRRPDTIALGLASLSMLVAVAGGTRIAGGADAYGYVSQAELWLDGSLKVRQPWVDQVPWPNPEWTFTPLGYRPVRHDGEWSIVPTYAAGLPMLMAIAKFAGGDCALFAVTPLLHGLAVLATYGLGRRLGSPATGLVAAWFLATSPIVVGTVEPLTDVSVMSAWSLAFYFLLGHGLRAAAASGLLVALAILIRPNLFLLAAPMSAWLLVRRSAAAAAGTGGRLPSVVVFAGCSLLGVAAVALVNHHLYGSAATSGYGRFEDQFALHRVLPNLGRYLTWFVETQTPLAVLGMAAILFPLRRLWPGVADRTVFAVFGLYVCILWAEYTAYLEFDSWGYLRFLLPSWPFFMLGLASIFVAAGRHGGSGVRRCVGVLVIALGAWNFHTAYRLGVFEQRQAARHEAPIGRLVREHTQRNSVVLAMERSGSLRYYAGRMTLRYDLLEPGWLDRAVDWMTEHGAHVYAVLDERQAAECKRRFAGQRIAAAFDRPVLVYDPAGTSLFDLSTPPDPTTPPIVITAAFPDVAGCDPPARLAPLVLR
jgi:Dolichyl-phosphate-mannose-protein mannosyltransferase